MSRSLLMLIFLIGTMPEFAGNNYDPMGLDASESESGAPQSTGASTIPAGRVASSSAGQVGERQTDEHPIAGNQPLTRIDSRIDSRIYSRIQNRIDKFYDPHANAASPFEEAAERARKKNRPAQR